MTVLTPQLLSQVLEAPQSTADACFTGLIEGMTRFQINNPADITCFFAQVIAESGGLQYFAELGPESYFHKYDNRSDLGNGPTDGFPFRGSGPIQVTGRANFTEAQQAMRAIGINGPDGQPIDITTLPNVYDANGICIKGPDLVRTHAYGTIISCWWWYSHGGNQVSQRTPLSHASLCCGRLVNRGDADSDFPAQNESDRIAAFQHVEQFGELSLPEVAPTPTQDWFDMATKADLAEVVSESNTAVEANILAAVKKLILTDPEVGLRIQNLIGYRHIPYDPKKPATGIHLDDALDIIMNGVNTLVGKVNQDLGVDNADLAIDKK